MFWGQLRSTVVCSCLPASASCLSSTYPAMEHHHEASLRSPWRISSVFSFSPTCIPVSLSSNSRHRQFASSLSPCELPSHHECVSHKCLEQATSCQQPPRQASAS
ncbi:hypothetical protein BDP55DRAFT_653356 [Colletotrichum godetiae]|uniref:Secreted protein n=1 Tax=Colletotrichum godetiae TaxID=1209918 RepID=A0AAJ0ASE0_9PEZI|nr:uncharacterized protein BDP55DRAFT_653356 [Colletotrichum godetiae]KAK1689508.1 hypothetical protein BDP55DRAFT_653356 [Colletotrichum godetiae]